MVKEKLKEKVKNLPMVPGIYKFKNTEGEIIYVGKAKNLRSRVRSYFQGNLDPESKTYALVEHINDMEFIEVMSELEALILEAELIKRYQPKYNIDLKDDKSYLYIILRNEKLELNGKKVTIPSVMTARRPDLRKTDTVFGPYPDGGSARYIVKNIRKILPYRDCTAGKFSRYEKLGRPCLYGYIGLCNAPCSGNISLEDYRKVINKIKRFLAGESGKILNSFRKEMEKAAKEENFEEAALIRDRLQKFDYVSRNYRSAEKYIENPYLVEDILSKSLDELVRNISILRSFPKRIECYDIANISGKEAVGSLVVATDGRIDKSEYRKFKIKFKEEPDDFMMLREVLFRRMHNDWPLPDLIVLDGGKGQVSSGLKVLSELGSDIPLIGLAKRLETIVYKEDTNFVEINLPGNNEGLKLLQRLRDEAHRFAQKYHHYLMLKKISG